MGLLLKTAWRNLFRQKRRTLITVSAMAVSLALAIPVFGLTEGINDQMRRGITGLELGHLQIHDPAYPAGRALSSALRNPEALLTKVRALSDVKAATARAHGAALASHDVPRTAILNPLPVLSPQALGARVLFGRGVQASAPWRSDPSLSCEALLTRSTARRHRVSVGMVLTPKKRARGSRCERIQIVGQLRDRPSDPQDGAFRVLMPRVDLERTFGSAAQRKEVVLLRHAAPIALTGIIPAEERRVTYLAEKVIEGRFLGSNPAGEALVGYRLARTLRLKPGSKLFVQAGSLNPTSGAFYQELKVVGIYRSGVDSFDRIRVFLHLTDAQKLMSLGKRAHEIVARLHKPELSLNRAVASLRVTSSKIDLAVITGTTGQRAGSAPLPGPVVVYHPDGKDAGLIEPYDLRRRFDRQPGLAALGRRVYGRVSTSAVSKVVARVEWTGRRAQKERPCTADASSQLRDKWRLRPGQRIARVTGDEATCSTVVVRGFFASNEAVLRVAAPGPDDDDIIPKGPATLLLPRQARQVRFVGVEGAFEQRHLDLARHLAAGRLWKTGRSGDGSWPLLLSARTAAALGVKLGEKIQLEIRNADGERRPQRARVAGLLANARWNAARPEMVLPYYLAQQTDARRLNAKAHELVLLPSDKTAVSALVKTTRSHLVPLVRSWKEIAPTLARVADLQKTMTTILMGIIFTIAAMTVMNTMLMAVFERTREFGVLKSIGMRPSQVFGMITFETFFIALCAVTLGGGIGFALDYYLSTTGLDLTAYTQGFTFEGAFIDPIWKSLITVRSVFLPVVMVAVICLVVSFYPALRAGRLRPVEALRHRG